MNPGGRSTSDEARRGGGDGQSPAIHRTAVHVLNQETCSRDSIRTAILRLRVECSASTWTASDGSSSRPAACPPPSSAVRDLAEVGSKRGQRGSSIGLHCLDIGGLGGVTFRVLQHQPDVAGAGPAPVVAERTTPDI